MLHDSVDKTTIMCWSGVDMTHKIRTRENDDVMLPSIASLAELLPK